MKSEAALLLEFNDTMTRLENALSREKQLEMSLDIARKTIMGYERENSAMRAALRRIHGACGLPDSEQACRAILNLVSEAVKG